MRPRSEPNKPPDQGLKSFSWHFLGRHAETPQGLQQHTALLFWELSTRTTLKNQIPAYPNQLVTQVYFAPRQSETKSAGKNEYNARHWSRDSAREQR